MQDIIIAWESECKHSRQGTYDGREQRRTTCSAPPVMSLLLGSGSGVGDGAGASTSAQYSYTSMSGPSVPTTVNVPSVGSAVQSVMKVPVYVPVKPAVPVTA